MSINHRLTLSSLTPRRLLLSAALAVTSLSAVAVQANAATFRPRTVLNYCSARSGLGRVYRGTYHGLGYIAWDTNYDGRIDHIALDTNRDGYVDLAIADTNEDGTPDWVGLCNGRPQLWYSWSFIQSRIQQSRATNSNTFTVGGVPNSLATALNAPYNAASNQVWSELGPGLSNLILSGDPDTVPIEVE